MTKTDQTDPMEKFCESHSVDDCLGILCSFGFKPVSNDETGVQLAFKKTRYIVECDRGEGHCRAILDRAKDNE